MTSLQSTPFMGTPAVQNAQFPEHVLPQVIPQSVIDAQRNPYYALNPVPYPISDARQAVQGADRIQYVHHLTSDVPYIPPHRDTDARNPNAPQNLQEMLDEGRDQIRIQRQNKQEIAFYQGIRRSKEDDEEWDRQFANLFQPNARQGVSAPSLSDYSSPADFLIPALVLLAGAVYALSCPSVCA